MRVQVAKQQHRLKEHETRIPHRWRAAKQRQHEFREQRLDPEKQKSARQGCEGEQRYHESI
jgi:hypothetical protein